MTRPSLLNYARRSWMHSLKMWERSRGQGGPRTQLSPRSHPSPATFRKQEGVPIAHGEESQDGAEKWGRQHSGCDS